MDTQAAFENVVLGFFIPSPAVTFTRELCDQGHYIILLCLIYSSKKWG